MRILFFSLWLSLVGTSTALAEFSFPDTLASWYKHSIQVLHDTGVIDGYPDGFFRPRQTINRAEFLKIAMIAANHTAIGDPTSRCFPDVDEEAWYAPHICRAKRMGIAKGHSDGLFRPGDPVTVHEGLAFISRALDLSIRDNTVGPWYLPYETYADNNKVVADHTYTVDTNLIRGQAARMVKEALASQKSTVRRPNLSSGCGTVPPATPPSSLQTSGGQRTFITAVPEQYHENTSYGLIVALHGRTNNNEQVRNYMGLEGKQSWKQGASYTQDDFFVVYPAGITLANGTFSWSEEESVELFDRMVDHLSERYCIDRNKIFVTGHSLGAWFAHKLACVRGDVIRGMAAVAGPGYKAMCSGPVASMVFHNSADPLITYSSGEFARDIREEKNSCSNTNTTVDSYGMNCTQAQLCRTGNPVIFCPYNETLGGFPHSWPTHGGRAILDFFRGLD